MQAATDSNVEVEIFGQAFNLCGVDPPGCILEIAEYVEETIHVIAEQSPEMAGTRLAVFTALTIAEQNHLLKAKLADGNRKRRQEYYTKQLTRTAPLGDAE